MVIDIVVVCEHRRVKRGTGQILMLTLPRERITAVSGTAGGILQGFTDQYTRLCFSGNMAATNTAITASAKTQ